MIGGGLRLSLFMEGGETVLKIYEYGGKTYQFEEGTQPEGAVEVKEKAAEPQNKAVKPANKKRTVKRK